MIDTTSIIKNTTNYMEGLGITIPESLKDTDRYFQAILYHFLKERYFLDKPWTVNHWFTPELFASQIDNTFEDFLIIMDSEIELETSPWLHEKYIIKTPTIFVQAPVGMGGDFLSTLIYNHLYNDKQLEFGEGGKCISDFDTIELQAVEQDHFWQLENPLQHANEIKIYADRAKEDGYEVYLTALHLDITQTLRYFENAKVVKILPKTPSDLNIGNINSLIKNYNNKIRVGNKIDYNKLTRWEVDVDSDKNELDEILDKNFNYPGGYLEYLGLNFTDIVTPSFNENWWKIYNVFYDDLYRTPRTTAGKIMKVETLHGILVFLGLQPNESIVNLLNKYVMHEKL